MSAHRWRSELLGDRLEIDLAAGRLEAWRRGDGPAVVFAHGWLSNANLWRGVVDRLAGRFTCVALDLPLGAHRVAIPGADLSPDGCGALIADSIAALGLEDVTLVGNDSGGAYSQIAVARHGASVARLALTSCETPYDSFPPAPFDALPRVAGDTAALGELLGALRDPEVRKLPAAFGLLSKHGLDPAASDSYALPCCEDADVLADAARAMVSARSEPVHTAGRELLRSFAGPVLFAWSGEDPVFPVANARRYCGEFAAGEFTAIDDAFSFTPEDQPGPVADALAAFAT